MDGVLLAEAGSCSPGAMSDGAPAFSRGARDHHYQSDQQHRSGGAGALESRPTRFNITSSGPCLQALTGGAAGGVTPVPLLQVILLAGVSAFLALNRA